MASTEAASTHGIHPVDGRWQNRRQIRLWLYAVIAALFALVLVGGATRLTESGLSITEWKPVHGVVPPMSDAEWQEEFALYRQIPQYAQLNPDMTIEGFKSIFWWEWAHRLIARSIGLIFAVPLAIFWARGRIEPRLKLPLVGILAMGGLQGVIGWWMVSSGLSARTEVSQYRLATHLVMACLIFSLCIWIARGLTPMRREDPPTSGSKWAAVGIVGLCFVQVYLGALVAGLDAGLSYNTWPLMDGAVIPSDLLLQSPAWINFFENPKTVQFAHRCGAYLLLSSVAVHMLVSLRLAPTTVYARQAVLLAGLVFCQAAIGITTLLLQVPVGWGMAHQAGALIVLGAAVLHCRSLFGEYPPQATIA